jgi:hypothetical protein
MTLLHAHCAGSRGFGFGCVGDSQTRFLRGVISRHGSRSGRAVRVVRWIWIWQPWHLLSTGFAWSQDEASWWNWRRLLLLVEGEKKVRRVCFGLNASTCDSLISLSAYPVILSWLLNDPPSGLFRHFDSPNNTTTSKRRTRLGLRTVIKVQILPQSTL